MSIPGFTPGYPLDGSSLGSSKPVIRNNIDGTFQAFSVDHQDQNEADAGYHSDIHMVPQGTWNSSARTGAPAGIAGFNQLAALNWTPSFTGATADTQLFSVTGGGGVSQLTGNQANQQGWCWMGGMLVQWGMVTFPGSSSHETGSVTFQGAVVPPSRSLQGINFPTACYVVIPGWIVSSSSITSSNNTLSIRSISTSSFVWVKNTNNSSDYTGFYWVAIGQ